MQAICDTLITLKKETERNITLSMVGMTSAAIFCICGVALCEVMYFHGSFDLTTTMLLNAFCIFLSYFCTGHFYSAHNLAKRKYTDLLSVITRGVIVTSEMEKDFDVAPNFLIIPYTSTIYLSSQLSIPVLSQVWSSHLFTHIS